MGASLDALRILRTERRHGGFTLLELLAGMAVFAIMAGIVLGGIRLGVRSWDAAAGRSDATEQIRIVHGVLRRQISSALPLASSKSGGWSLEFEGGRDALHFVTELPGYVTGGGIHHATVGTESDGKHQRLVLRWRPLHALDEEAPPEQAMLAENITNVRLEYFGARDRNALPEWRDDWRDSRTLPRLVKLSVVDEDGQAWPDLVVALEVDAVRFIASAESAGAAEVFPGLGAQESNQE